MPDLEAPSGHLPAHSLPLGLNSTVIHDAAENYSCDFTGCALPYVKLIVTNWVTDWSRDVVCNISVPTTTVACN